MEGYIRSRNKVAEPLQLPCKIARRKQLGTTAQATVSCTELPYQPSSNKTNPNKNLLVVSRTNALLWTLLTRQTFRKPKQELSGRHNVSIKPSTSEEPFIKIHAGT